MHRLPLIVRQVCASLQQTSVAMEEASTNLGATKLRTMLQITLPLLTATLVAGTIMTFSFAMLDVSNGMILAQESTYYPITKAIYALLSEILPSAPSLACALGGLGMAFLGLALWLSSKIR